MHQAAGNREIMQANILDSTLQKRNSSPPGHMLAIQGSAANGTGQKIQHIASATFETKEKQRRKIKSLLGSRERSTQRTRDGSQGETSN